MTPERSVAAKNLVHDARNTLNAAPKKLPVHRLHDAMNVIVLNAELNDLEPVALGATPSAERISSEMPPLEHSLRPMIRPAFVARWMMHSSTEHGSGELATFDVGTPRDARIRLDGGAGIIEPLQPEYWAHLAPGMSIPVLAGSRLVGQATIVERRWPEILTNDVTDFTRAVRRYCAFIATGAQLPLEERLAEARAHLLALYAGGAKLPDAEPCSDDDAPRVPHPEGWFRFDEYDYYWTVFDAYDHENEKRSVGSLLDDVVETYQDVRDGLWHWEREEFDDAVWQWRFGFMHHWGTHAVEAVRAIHHALERRR